MSHAIAVLHDDCAPHRAGCWRPTVHIDAGLLRHRYRFLRACHVAKDVARRLLLDGAR